jgi:hypothetical protein
MRWTSYPRTETPLDYQPQPARWARLKAFFAPRKDDTHERLITVIERYRAEAERRHTAESEHRTRRG